jgi:hypothetical protein
VAVVGTARFVGEELRDTGTVLAAGFHYRCLRRSCRLGTFSLTATVSRFGVLAGVRLHPRIVHLLPVVCRCLFARSAASLVLALDGVLFALIQRGYTPFVVKTVWLGVLMSGAENVFPRQYIGKPFCLVHSAWFTWLSSCRGQKSGIAFISWGCSGRQPGQ